MSRFGKTWAFAILLATVALMASCRRDATSVPTERGKVQVLLLGMKGCPGTESATPLLAAYAKEAPEGMTVMRVEVPPPGKTISKPEGLPAGLTCKVDTGRQMAKPG